MKDHFLVLFYFCVKLRSIKVSRQINSVGTNYKARKKLNFPHTRDRSNFNNAKSYNFLFLLCKKTRAKRKKISILLMTFLNPWFPQI